MNEANEGKPDTWAIVDLMGHLRIAGRFTEEEVAGVKMGRIDVPGEDGSFTTQYFGGQSVYRICLVSEAVARATAKGAASAPVSAWDYPKQLAFSPPPYNSPPSAEVSTYEDVSSEKERLEDAGYQDDQVEVVTSKDLPF